MAALFFDILHAGYSDRITELTITFLRHLEGLQLISHQKGRFINLLKEDFGQPDKYQVNLDRNQVS